MTDPSSSPSRFARIGRAVAVLRACLAFVRRIIFSARAWVLLVVLVIALLATYYVLSDLHTPFTTDAYVQAYVVQVAPQIDGQVVRVVRRGEPGGEEGRAAV